MKNKNLVLLSILTVLILGGWYLKSPYKQKELEILNGSRIFSALDLNLIDKITVTKGQTVNELMRNGDKWYLSHQDDFEADENIINYLLDSLALASSSIPTVVSNKEENKYIYGTDKNNAKLLQVWQGDKKIIEAMVGNYNSGKTYYSEIDKSETMEIVSDLSASLNESDWRSKVIFKVPIDSLSELKIYSQKSKKELDIIKNNQDWIIKSTKEKLNKDKVSALISALTSLNATSIPRQDLPDTGLNNPFYKIEFITGTETKILLIGKQSENNYFAKTGSSNKVYLIDKSQVAIFDTDLVKLK